MSSRLPKGDAGLKEMKKVAVGCDPNASEFKETIKKHLIELGYEWEDYGSDDPIYANVAIRVAEAISSGKHDRGILVCGTGIGMCMTANKVPGAYAALCSDAYSTERSIKSNNANIMTLGSRSLGQSWQRLSSRSGWNPNTSREGGRSRKSKGFTITAEKRNNLSHSHSIYFGQDEQD